MQVASITRELAVGISDDDDCHAMLELCSSKHSIKLYVKKDIVIHQEPEDHGQFTRMLDLDNESTSFMPLIYNTQVFVNFIIVYTTLSTKCLTNRNF